MNDHSDIIEMENEMLHVRNLSYNTYSAMSEIFATNGSAIVGLAHDSMAVYLVVVLQCPVYDEMAIDSVNFMQVRDKQTVDR